MPEVYFHKDLPMCCGYHLRKAYQQFKTKNKMGDKKIFFKLTGIIEPDYIIMPLEDLQAMIKNDLESYMAGDELPTYTVEPIYMTQEEYENMPDFNG